MYSYLNGDQLAVRYTLQTDDLSKGGAKNFAKPYNDRKSYFEPCTGGLYDEKTKSSLKTEFVSYEKRRGLKIVMQTARKDLSEFSLELPLNFMGKKNGGGWQNQYLFNSPYSSANDAYKSDNPQIDSSKTKYNYHMHSPDGLYTEFINQRIADLNLTPRKDAVVMNSIVVGADKAFFNGLSKLSQYNFFSDCTKFFEDRYGMENVISAVIHMDESTPHMHLNLVPITPDGRLCSKELFDKTKLRQLQTDFYNAVGKKYGLQRGKEGSQAKHLSTAEFKAKKIIEQAEAIRQKNQVYADALAEAKNGDISRKRGRLQEQVVALTAENKDLTKRLDHSMGETLEYAKKAETLQREKDSDSHYARVGKTLARTNPTEYKRISQGKPKNIGSFFDSVLSMFTLDVTMRLPQLQQIEREI